MSFLLSWSVWRPDRRAYRKQVSGYLGGQIRVGSGHRLHLFGCVRDALGQHGQLGTLTLVAVVTNPTCACCKTACFHCHFDISVHDTKCHPGKLGHVLKKKPLMQHVLFGLKRASISYNPQSALSSLVCLTMPHSDLITLSIAE